MLAMWDPALWMSGNAVAEAEPARQLFEGRCAICHQLPEPDMLNARQWRMVMITMQKRMQQSNMPALTDDEFQFVLDYLVKNVH